MISKKLLFSMATVLVLSACNDRAALCDEMVSQGIFNQTAFEHCKAASDKGDSKAKVNYAKVLLHRGDTDTAQQILEKEAEAKNLDAVLELLRLSSEKDDEEVDEEVISNYLHQACDLGHKAACDGIKEMEKELAELERSKKQAEIDAEKARLQAEHEAKAEALRKEKAEFEANKAREEARLAQERQDLEAMYEGDGEECISEIDHSKLKFNEDMAYFKEECSGLYGFVNSRGEVVIPAQFKNAGGVYNGRAVVQDHNELWGYIDKQGNWIIRPQYCMAGRFNEGLAGVYVGGYKQGSECYGGKWGFITPNGKIAIEPNFDKAWAFSKSGGIIKAKVEVGNYTGYINSKGEWVD